MSMHEVRFPGESTAYRAARDRLLEAELALRQQVERVAAMRRALPLGGEVQDYEFDEGERRVRLSQLFPDGKDTLAVYSFMYGPAMENACPLCTSVLDGLDGQAHHIQEHMGLAVVAKSPIARIREHGAARGWRRLRLLSSAGTTYQPDYGGESKDGKQLPAMNVFVRRGGRIHHFWNSELFFAKADAGQDARHVDMFWPLWNVLDLGPEGRSAEWRPKLLY
jgi:predicted dithiol-disulfide oxidoreductase (DUF899 family)